MYTLHMLTDEGIDLAQGERRGRVALEIAPDEPVVGDAEVQGGRTGSRDDGRAVLLHEGEDAEDAADAALAVAAVDALAERADRDAGVRRSGQTRARSAKLSVPACP